MCEKDNTLEQLVSQKSRSYTYQDRRTYNAQDDTNGLPFSFWRETIGFARSADESVTSNLTEYSEQYANRQMVLWTRAVARYTNRLVFVGLVAAIVSFFQWYEIHSGGADTHDLAEAAKEQAKAAAIMPKQLKNPWKLLKELGSVPLMQQ